MAAISDRSLFLELIKTQPMTINDVISHFGVAMNTARSWVKHPEVEHVKGSWPPQYVRKNSFTIETPVVDRPKLVGKEVLIVEIPRRPKEQLEQFFQALMGDEVPHFNFNIEIRSADSQKNLQEILTRLKSGILVTEHYLTMMQQEGID
jgi:hypothetical protein